MIGFLRRGARELRWWILVSALARAAFAAADAPAPVPPLPTLVAYAHAQKIALAGIDAPAATPAARAGDAITALIVLREGRRARQWLSQFEIAEPTAKERADHPPRQMEVTIGESSYRFSATPNLALDIRTAGPFSDSRKPPDAEKRARALLSPDFLSLGFDQACVEFLRIMATQTAAPSAQSELPATASRSLAGLMPALISLFETIQHTPGWREILWEVVDLPSAWSVLKRGGKVEPSFNLDGFAIADGAAFGLTNHACYRMSLILTLNGQPALQCSLFVTAPRPPLLSSAGVIGIVANSPGKKDKQVEIRVIAARLAARP